MSDVDVIEAVEIPPHNGDTSARQLINAAKLDTSHTVLRTRFNKMVSALDAITRDDNTLTDALVRTRNLHPEVLANFGQGGNVVNVYQTGDGSGSSGGGVGYNVMDDEFGAAGTGLSTPLSSVEAADFNSRFGIYGLVVSAGDERDWAAIQAALYKAMTTGYRVHLPPGLYCVNKPLDYSSRVVPLTGQPSIPPAIVISGEGYKTEVKGYSIDAGRATWEFLGANNGQNVRVELRDMRLTHDWVTCAATAYCVRLGDSKTGSKLSAIWCEGASGVLLKFASTLSYANSCTILERVIIRANYGNAWSPPASSTSWALNIEDGGARCDNIKIDSSYIYGPAKVKAMVCVIINTQFANVNGQAGEMGRNLTINGGSVQIFGSYFEEYITSIYAEATSFHIEEILVVGCLFNGSSVVASQYGLHAKYNAAFAFGRMVIIGCHAAVPSHSVVVARWDQVDGQIQDCAQRNLIGDWTIAVANGAKVLSINRGKITSYLASAGEAFLIHAVSVDGSIGTALSNSNTGTSARYTESVSSNGSTRSHIMFGSNYSVVALRNAAYYGNGNGPIVWGVGGGLDMTLAFSKRLLIGAGLTDNGVSRVQVEGGINLLPQAGNDNVDGSVWSDSVNGSLKTYQKGTRTFVPGLLAAGYADKVVGNTNVETTLITPTVLGTVGMAANFLAPGKTLRLRFQGHATNTGTPSIQVRVYLGATLVANTGIVTMSTISGTRRWQLEVEIMCRSDGVSGTVIAQGELTYYSAAGTKQHIPIVATATTTVDTTAALAVGATATWGATDVANVLTATQFTLEAVG